MANIAANIAPLLVKPSTTPTQLKQATNQGIANGLYFYLNLQKIFLVPPVYPSVGVISTAPPVPGAALTSLNMTIPSPTILKTLLDGVTGTPTPSPVPNVSFFQAIATWLSAPPIPVFINSALSIPPTINGSSIINFPLMPSMGTVSFYAMLAAGATGLMSELLSKIPFEAPYEILSNFIYAGLVANFISPIPTFGVIGAPYSGMTFGFFLPLDCPDFPVGEVCNSNVLKELLKLFGMDDLSDESILAKQDELSKEDDTPPKPSDCDLIFDEETGKYSQNPLCEDPIINKLFSSGCSSTSSVSGNDIQPQFDKPLNDVLLSIPETSADAGTVWKTMPDTSRNVFESSSGMSGLFDDYPDSSLNVCKDLFDNTQINKINDYSVSSTALNTPEVPYDKPELEYSNININIFNPSITTFFERPSVIDGISPTSVVVTNKT